MRASVPRISARGLVGVAVAVAILLALTRIPGPWWTPAAVTIAVGLGIVARKRPALGTGVIEGAVLWTAWMLWLSTVMGNGLELIG